MKKWWWVLCSFCGEVAGQAAVVQRVYEEPSFGMRFPVFDVRQLFFEPAVQSPETGWSASLAQHSPWLGTGIRFGQAAACYFEKKGSWFGGAVFGGTDALKRTDLLMGASRSLGGGWSVGITAGMGMLRAPGVAKGNWPLYSAGISKIISGSWCLTSTLENPIHLPGRWRPPLLLRTGLLVMPGKYFTVKCLLITEEDQVTALFMGFQVMPSENTWVRSGWLTGQQLLLAGFGLRYGSWAFETGTRFHFLTGFSPSVALHFNKQKP